MPTLQDVAQRAGVSTATVSKVISNTPYVSAATRSRVLKAIKDIGYRPNLAARALASGRTYIIAVVFPYIYDAIFQDPLVMRILEGIEAVCTAQHYNLLLSTPRLHKGKVDDHYIQLVQSGYIEGLIAIDNVAETSFAVESESWNVPTVILGYHKGKYQIHSDNYSGGKQMMDYLLELGHTCMGIISVPSELNMAIDQRIIGIQAALMAADKNMASLPIAYGDFSSESGAEAAQQLLNEQADLTAILCINDRMAIGAMRQLQQMGKHIPDDISVIGYDNIDMSIISNPPLTTIDQPASTLGQNAAKMLFELLDGQSPNSQVLPTRLIVRESTAML